MSMRELLLLVGGILALVAVQVLSYHRNATATVSAPTGVTLQGERVTLRTQQVARNNQGLALFDRFMTDQGDSIDFDKLVDYAHTKAEEGSSTGTNEPDNRYLDILVKASQQKEVAKWNTIERVFLELRQKYGARVWSSHLYDLNSVQFTAAHYTPLVMSSRFWESPSEKYLFKGRRRAMTRLTRLFEGIKEFGNAGDSVLDIGCETGLHTFLFAKNGYNAVGIDNGVETQMARHSNILPMIHKNLSDIYGIYPKFIYGDYLGHLRETGDTFDHILYLSVWHHDLTTTSYRVKRTVGDPKQIPNFLVDKAVKSMFMDFGKPSQLAKQQGITVNSVADELRTRKDVQKVEILPLDVNEWHGRDLIVISKSAKRMR